MLANALLFLSLTGLPQIDDGLQFPGCRHNSELVERATAARAAAEAKAEDARREADARAAEAAAAYGEEALAAAATAAQKAAELATAAESWMFEEYLQSFAKGGRLLGSAENAGLRCAPALTCVEWWASY